MALRLAVIAPGPTAASRQVWEEVLNATPYGV
ncbi:MAG: hypothetical protein QOC89_1904 [Paraburkholderia sp.]|nr:hypothetical protein [Paraburkholderia sp.]